MRIITKVCAVVTLPVLMSACAVDVGKVYKDLQRPKVEFAQAVQWRCDEKKVNVPHGSVVEPCDRCVNAATTPQTVTISKVEQTVKPGGSVLICSTAAWVEGQ